MSKKDDLQAKADELGIDYNSKTTIAELETAIAEKEGESAPAAETPAETPETPAETPSEETAATEEPETPEEPAEPTATAKKGEMPATIEPTGVYVVAEDKGLVRMYNERGVAVSPTYKVTDRLDLHEDGDGRGKLAKTHLAHTASRANALRRKRTIQTPKGDTATQ